MSMMENMQTYPDFDLQMIRLIRFFPKLHKVSNIANRGLHGEEQDKFSKNCHQANWTQDFLIITLILNWLY